MLVGDSLAGMSVKSLAERYGIQRATVFSHLRRRNVPSRRPGLGTAGRCDSEAECSSSRVGHASCFFQLCGDLFVALGCRPARASRRETLEVGLVVVGVAGALTPPEGDSFDKQVVESHAGLP